ncbi:MAG: 3D domain-containing protein [Acidobacteriota bacterium]|nr:3D domain-containing protein [Acidobacteriota bacterium]
MKYPAGGAAFLGAIVLLAAFLFYFQPTAEAVTLASDSQFNLQPQFNQLGNQTNQSLVQTPAANLDSKTSIVKQANAFRATAYCLKGRMATGGSVRRGIVAADPRVLPLGSRIQLSAGSYSGTYTVADTGGAVKGRILDIWMPSCVEAVRFGRRNVMVSRLARKS